MILSELESSLDEEELSVELSLELESVAAGSASTTFRATSKSGAPRSIPPVEYASICFAFIAASF